MYYFKVRGVLCKGMLSPLWNKQDSSRRKASSRLLPDLHSLPRPEPCSTRGMQLYHHRLKRITTNKHWITTKKKKPTPVSFPAFLDIAFFGEPQKRPRPQVISAALAASERWQETLWNLPEATQGPSRSRGNHMQPLTLGFFHSKAKNGKCGPWEHMWWEKKVYTEKPAVKKLLLQQQLWANKMDASLLWRQ